MVIGAMDFFSHWFGECVNYCWFICQFQWVALNKLNSHSNRWRVPINTSYRLYYYEWCKKKWFSLNHRKKPQCHANPRKRDHAKTHTHTKYLLTFRRHHIHMVRCLLNTVHASSSNQNLFRLPSFYPQICHIFFFSFVYVLLLDVLVLLFG